MSSKHIKFFYKPDKFLDHTLVVEDESKLTRVLFIEFFSSEMEKVFAEAVLDDADFCIIKLDEADAYMPLNDEKPYIFKKSVTSIEIRWQSTITLWPYGTCISTTTSQKKPIGDLLVTSKTSFDKIMRDIKKKCLRHVPDIKKVSYLIDPQLPFTEENFYSDLSPVRNVFVLSHSQSYSHLVLANLFAKVSFEFPFDYNAKSLSDIFDHLSSEVTGNRLMERISLLDQHLTSTHKTRMDEDIKITYDHLSLLHATYQPSLQVREAGRRLIINDLVIAAAHIVGVTWEVEKSVFTNQQPGTIGWGPLDYYFDQQCSCQEGTRDVQSVIVTKSLVEDFEIDMVEHEANMLVDALLSSKSSGVDAATASDATTASDAVFEDINVKAIFAEVEAKKASMLNGLAQISAQLYDIAMNQLKEDLSLSQVQVRGTLSTGRLWRFFTLIARRGESKARLYFDGQLPLYVLRTLISRPLTETQSHTGPLGKKPKLKSVQHPSGGYFDEAVWEEQVTTVVKALVASFVVPVENYGKK